MIAPAKTGRDNSNKIAVINTAQANKTVCIEPAGPDIGLYAVLRD